MPSSDRPVTVVVPLPPSYRGGTEEYAYSVAVRIAREVPVRILTTTVRWSPKSELLDTGAIPTRLLPARELFERPLVLGLENARELRSAVLGSRLVQLHMPFPFVERRVTRWGRVHGVPVVLTYHMDADFGGASGAPGSSAVTWGYRRLSAFPALLRASAVVSNSGGYARHSPVLSRYLPKIRVIAKGVDPQRLGIDPATRTAPPRAEPNGPWFPAGARATRRVVFVGRFVPYKGLPNLLRAVGMLLRDGEDVAVYLAGRGPMLEELRRLSQELGLGERAHFLGFVADERLGELYRAADVVACPSVSALESTATTLEEASACGVPVLGSALPGAEETIPHDGVHGILTPPGDLDALAHGLRRLLNQPRPSDRSVVRTWDDTAREYLHLFEDLERPTGAVPSAA